MKVRQRLWWVLGGVFFLFCIGFVLATYRFGWSSTGFLSKSLWDWLQLLIIPLVLALIALVFQRANSRTEQQIAKQRYEQDRQIALEKQREDLLQAYLDRMAELLLKEKLRSSAVDAEVRNMARVRTITTLFQLDARRIGIVFAFLLEAGLMSNKPNSSIVSLSQADLTNINLSHANLENANLSNANLSSANLYNANLYNANLYNANLSNADLTSAYISEANLSKAHLLNADLSNANLSKANLEGANLEGANLERARLWGANLEGANLRLAMLRFANLEGANLEGANLEGARLWGANLEGANLSDARVTTKSELPNADEKYIARHPKRRDFLGPKRTFGGPLCIPCDVIYIPGEFTVEYIQRSPYVLVWRLALVVILLANTIFIAFLVPSLFVFMSLLVVFLLIAVGLIIIYYVDDVYILTNKRIIDIQRKYIIFDDDRIEVEYKNIRDILVKVSNVIEYALNIGDVHVQTPGNSPDLLFDGVAHPFALQDKIFFITNHVRKNEERKQ